MDHPCRNNPEGLLFQSVERSIWCVRLFFDKQWKRRTAKLFWFVHAHAFFFYGSGSPLSATFSATIGTRGWVRAEGGGSENIWQERTRIGEGANLVVGGSKVKTVCVRLIRAPGLMSRLQARRICAFNRGTCADVTAMCKQILVDFCSTVFGLLASVWLCSAGLGCVPPCVRSTLTPLVVAPQWGCTPRLISLRQDFFFTYIRLFFFFAPRDLVSCLFLSPDFIVCFLMPKSCLNEKVLSILLSAPHASRAATISRRYRLGRRHNSTNVKIDALTTRIVVMVNY